MVSFKLKELNAVAFSMVCILLSLISIYKLGCFYVFEEV